MFGATDKQRQLWLTVLLLSSTLGVLFGYIMTTQFIGRLEWQWAFYVQIAAVIPIELCLAVTPIRYLDLQLAALIKQGLAANAQPSQRVEDGRNYRPVTASIRVERSESRLSSMGSPDSEFFALGRMKSQSFDKFGFQGDIARGVFSSERAPSVHLSMSPE